MTYLRAMYREGAKRAATPPRAPRPAAVAVPRRVVYGFDPKMTG